MTVGISLTNGKEAFVVADRRASGHGRKTDSFDKITPFSAPNYGGVVFGSGEGNVLLALSDKMGDIKEANLDDYVHQTHQKLNETTDFYDQLNLDFHKGEIMKKSSMIPDEKKRKQFIKSQTINAMRDYDKSKQPESNNRTDIWMVAFDKDLGKIRYHGFNNLGGFVESFIYHVITGSGSDGADAYFSQKLQGLNPKTFSTTDLAFHLMNAYSFSTMSSGVGGIPQVRIISEKGVQPLALDEEIVLTNLSGAYLSEFNNNLTASKTKEIISNVLKKEKLVYKDISSMLDLNEKALTTMAIPYGTWQERANMNYVENHKE